MRTVAASADPAASPLQLMVITEVALVKDDESLSVAECFQSKQKRQIVSLPAQLATILQSSHCRFIPQLVT